MCANVESHRHAAVKDALNYACLICMKFCFFVYANYAKPYFRHVLMAAASVEGETSSGPLVVDLAAMPDGEDLDDESVVLDEAEDAVVSHAIAPLARAIAG